MRTARSVAVAIALLGLTACGGGDDEGEEAVSADTALSLELTEQNGSQQSGTATLTPVGDERTKIEMELTNPPGVPQPAHVHPGPCDDLGDPVAALANVVRGRSETTVPLSFAELRRGDLVVHAHKSEREYEISVACAPIPEAGESLSSK
jgi:hypothetical protein